MGLTQDELDFDFVPAETSDEAISRIFSLTGREVRTRGEKRALVALRDALGLDVDVVRTNSVLASRLAEALDVEWRPAEFTVRHTVNLSGLNVLLEGAFRAYRRGSLSRIEARLADTLVGAQWEGFKPAVSKIEAVTRIARLTGAPEEWLGPGSKEHKSVFENLGDRLLPDTALDRSSKTRLARDIAFALGVGWTDECYSTGETVSLKGLNTILAGAEMRLGRLGASALDLLASADDEAAALVAALLDGWRAEPWDGMSAVEWMFERGVRGYNDNEWQGWYYEARGGEILNAAFPPGINPPKSRYGSTLFDYRLNRVWDLKAHTVEQTFPISGRTRSGDAVAILNDVDAITACVDEQGLGFLVLNGRAEMDEDGSFLAWHREFKSRQGKVAAPSNSGRSRMRKRSFWPLNVEAFWLANAEALRAAIVAGQLRASAQGRQAPKVAGKEGAARADKFHIDMRKARTGLRLATRAWRYPDSAGDLAARA
jgi:hypothetical protein